MTLIKGIGLEIDYPPKKNEYPRLDICIGMRTHNDIDVGNGVRS